GARLDTLEHHPRGGAVTLGHHHRVDGEGRDARHAGFGLQLVDELAVLRERTRALEDEHVRVDAEHLVAELFVEAAGHADGCRQPGDAERHTQDGEEGAERNERALLRPHVAERELEWETHGWVPSTTDLGSRT